MNFLKDKALFTPPLRLAFLMLVMLAPMQSVWAAGPPKPSSVENPVVITLLVIIVGLLLVIGILANVVLSAAGFYSNKKKVVPGAKALLFVTAILIAVPAVAGGEVKGSHTAFRESVADIAFYTLIAIIFLELIVIGVLLYHLTLLLRFKEEPLVIVTAKHKPALYWFEKWNRFVAPEKEYTIDMGHEYDGIRELDNRLPPWWLYGFYLSIIFSVIYLWHFHVSGAGLSSAEEFRIAMEKAKIDQEAYLKKAANSVDETSVEFISDAGQLAAGKTVFLVNCAACHGRQGEGGVGPNLTDAYWLHGGTVRDIFKVVKYGVPEKGMKSWKDDFSPSQMAQVSSYIKTLEGTNPPGAKAQQGNLLKE